jgi:hypothetical protein
MMEFIKGLTSLHTDSFTTKIPIFHSDGTELAVAKGARLFETKAGKKAGVTIREIHTGNVCDVICEMNGKPVFELRRKGPAALAVTAELFTFDGAFLKWSEQMWSAVVSPASGALQIGGLTMMGSTIQAEVGIQIGRPTTHFGTGILLDFPPRSQ